MRNTKTTDKLRTLEVGKALSLPAKSQKSIGVRAKRLGIKVATRRTGTNGDTIKVHRIE